MKPCGIGDIGFRLFIVLWNQREGRSTPALHLKIANWL